MSEQTNGYKGSPPRAWIRLRLYGAGGATEELDVVVDTGNPLPLVIGEAKLKRYRTRRRRRVPTNFGILQGGRLRVMILGGVGEFEIVGYGSDAIIETVKQSDPGFDGLIGLPMLRLLEFGGDAEGFWMKTSPA